MAKPTVIACMDSGVGGLAVLRQLLQILPQQHYCYVGDTAWMPYGEKSIQTVQKRVLSIHQWLSETYDLQAFVLACNTASSASLARLQAMALPYPVLDPIQTTATALGKATTEANRVGVMATPATVSTHAYAQAIDESWEVVEIPCEGLSTLIEQGHCEDELLSHGVRPYLAQLQESNVHRVVLGCTHYSFIAPVIQQALGPDVQLLDSSRELAEAVAGHMADVSDLPSQECRIQVTGEAEAFQRSLGLLPQVAHVLPEWVAHQVID